MKNGMKGGLFVALAFSLFLVACDKELPDSKLRGKEVLVRVRLVGIGAGKEADMTRSASMKEPARVATPVGDGVVMEMRMERDTSALRANVSTLDGDAYFRVVALEHGTKTFISYDDFTINGGAVSGSLHVPINGSYDFVCYSYNTDTPLDALTYNQDVAIPDTKTINVLQGTNDLLYKKIEDVQVGNEAPELPILLERVMARVQVIIDCSYNNWTITGVTGVTLTTVNTGGTIRLTDKVVASSTGSPTLTWAGSSDQRKAEILVMPKASSTLTVSIPVNAITRQGITAIPSAAVDNTYSTNLVSGLSYTLRIKFWTPKFAGSNIYWDGDDSSGKMTFDKYGTRTHEGYGGLFFRWGSLVGISPKGTFSVTTPVYVSSGSGWAPSTAGLQGYNGWTTSPSNLPAGTIEIPYMDVSYGQVDLAASEQNVPTMWADRRGDICQFIGSKDATLSGYRMPIKGEFGSLIESLNKEGWTLLNGSAASEDKHDDYGTGNFTSKVCAQNPNINSNAGGIIFVGCGYRHYVDGIPAYAGNLGCYHIATAPSAINSSALFRFQGTSYPGGSLSLHTYAAGGTPSYGFAVRCVLAD
jgi:hypothetical protein